MQRKDMSAQHFRQKLRQMTGIEPPLTEFGGPPADFQTMSEKTIQTRI
jgi:hypothetical protein